MIKFPVIFASIAVMLAASACDVQSGITRNSVEKHKQSPTPAAARTPEPPIDPADVVTVDVAVPGPNININKPEARKKFNCAKFNRVIVNADGKDIAVDGACQQIMINGDNNKVAAVAVAEIVFNGSGNTVEHTKYVNGKRPIIADNTRSNTVTKTASP
ncbi:MAG TPA: DUF3060 domain-containing protein [Pyrinomonadaceae bacterium]|nr:DUF3060 domain-containing protein [Pyrinomonadaceae bacterium]